uniref:FIG028593: membrane protein n=1 Tax=Rheinheimera sp. BAL341 TaxID=1708203 RepID=A0A486XIA6_9GAMM
MQYIQWIIKGLAMGAADVVPGVSGGTLAFILGIYERLLAAISSCNMAAVRLLLRGRVSAAWQHIDGTFLCCLFGGVLLSMFSLAGIIIYLLEHKPIPLWALFCALIVTALPHLCRSVRWSAWRLLLCVAGIGFAVLVGMLTPRELEPQAWMFFVAGAVAICAMILPGISGSFILLMSGMYAPVLLAVTELQFGVLSLFMLGCIIGLLSFSRLLNWLLRHYHDASLALLIGVVIGALYRIWPWQAEQQLYLPWNYASDVGAADIMPAMLSALAGIVVMLLLLNMEKWLKHSAKGESITD